MEDAFADALRTRIAALKDHYDVCGVVDRKGNVYPLGADTKVLSTIFELLVRRTVYETAASLGLTVKEPDVQNHYPDFTIYSSTEATDKIAVDVKTTYRNKSTDRFGYTLGGYTSFLRNERKNIVFPYSQYKAHWVIGFVYDRVALKKSADYAHYKVGDIEHIPLPFKNVEVFVQEKWRISGDRAGSGNTTNIGSIVGTLDDFVNGRGVFSSDDEFHAYWRGYERTAGERADAYSNVGQFRAVKKI